MRSCESLRGTSTEVCKLGIFLSLMNLVGPKKIKTGFMLDGELSMVQLSVILSFLLLFSRMAGSLTLKLIGRSLGTSF